MLASAPYSYQGIMLVDLGQNLAQPDNKYSVHSVQLPVMHAADLYEMAKFYSISMGAFTAATTLP